MYAIRSYYASVHLCKTRVRGALKKWRARRKAFASLRREVGLIAPHRIYVGNDRRIEFAFASYNFV